MSLRVKICGKFSGIKSLCKNPEGCVDYKSYHLVAVTCPVYTATLSQQLPPLVPCWKSMLCHIFLLSATVSSEKVMVPVQAKSSSCTPANLL